MVHKPAVIFLIDNTQILFVYLSHSMGGKAEGMSACFLKCQPLQPRPLLLLYVQSCWYIRGMPPSLGYFLHKYLPNSCLQKKLLLCIIFVYFLSHLLKTSFHYLHERYNSCLPKYVKIVENSSVPHCERCCCGQSWCLLNTENFPS